MSEIENSYLFVYVSLFINLTHAWAAVNSGTNLNFWKKHKYLQKKLDYNVKNPFVFFKVYFQLLGLFTSHIDMY
jgi:hypothetical protein